jgi:hypothetical protein
MAYYLSDGFLDHEDDASDLIHKVKTDDPAAEYAYFREAKSAAKDTINERIEAYQIMLADLDSLKADMLEVEDS